MDVDKINGRTIPLRDNLLSNLTPEGVYFPIVVSGDGIQMNTAAALPLPVVAVFACSANKPNVVVK